MSASSSGVPSAENAGLQSVEELNDFKLIIPEPATASSATAHAGELSLQAFAPVDPEAGERATAGIVIMLTLACTVLSLFDLFLLASGS